MVLLSHHTNASKILSNSSNMTIDAFLSALNKTFYLKLHSKKY